MSPTDAVLLEQWNLHRDPDAFAEIVSRYSGLVYATCKRVLRNPPDAEDVTQDCFVELMQAGRNVRSSLAGWLHTMAVHRSLDRLKAERRRRGREDRYAAQECQNAKADESEILCWVDEAIDELPEKLKAPIVQRFLEGRTHQEVAQALGVAESTVRLRLNTALAQIRVSLGKHGAAVSIAALVAVMGTRLAEAAPAHLIANLGKRAIAQAILPGTGHTGTFAGLSGLGVKTAVGLGLVILVAFGFVAQRIAIQEPAAELASLPSGDSPAQNQSGLSAEPHAQPALYQTGEPNDVELALRPADAKSLKGRDSGVQDPSGSEHAAAIPQSVEPSSISGYVMSNDGYAISGAVVTVVPGSMGFGNIVDAQQRGGTGLSDDTGAYAVRDIGVVGDLVVSASAQGFQHGAKNVKVESAQNIQEFNFVLSPGVSLRGQLLDRAGAPVHLARIQRWGFWGETDRGNGYYDNVTTTDEAGLFTMGFREEGNAVLKAFSEADGESVFVDIPVGGQEVVVLRMQEPASLAGRVTHVGGSPASDVAVEIQGRFSQTGWPTQYHVRTDQEGRYGVDPVVPGLDYVLNLKDSQSALLSSEESVGRISPGEDKIHDVVIRSSATVAGHVTGQNTGRPLTNLIIRCQNQGQPLGEGGALGQDPLFSQMAPVDAEGNYRLTVFTSGPCLVFPEYDSSRRAQAVAQYATPLSVVAGGEYVVDFSLPDPFALSVCVVGAGGEPIGDAAVEVRRRMENGSPSLFHIGKTGVDGRFVWPSFESGVESWFTVRKEGYVEVETSHVTGESGVAYPEETVVLHGSAGVGGSIVDANGIPCADTDFHIRVEAAEGSRVLASVSGKSDDTGSFLVPEGIPGTRVLLRFNALANSGEVSAAVGPVECVPGEAADMGRVILLPVPSPREK